MFLHLDVTCFSSRSFCHGNLSQLLQGDQKNQTNPQNPNISFQSEPIIQTFMKTPFAYSLLAAAVVCGLANAQTAYTTPVGYVTQPLVQGTNNVGITLHTPAIAKGSIDTVNGTALTDSDTTFSPVSGRLYVLEITSGTLNGTIQEVPAASISGGTITTPDNLGALGLQVGTTYSLRVAPTLEEVFTTVPLNSGGVLHAALNATSADVVWVPKASGGFDKYFLRTGSPATFRSVATGLTTPNVPLVYADGLQIQKKGTTSASLTISGELKTTGTNSVIVQGMNLLSIVAPVGLNLGNAGLEDDLTASLNSTNADIVWVQQANLSYKKYFRRTGTPQTWRDVASPAVALTQEQINAISLPSAILIQKKGSTATNLDLVVPTSYSSL
jgi:hypothetical protein